MQKRKAAICIAALQVVFSVAFGQAEKTVRSLKSSDNLIYVDPLIGNVAQLLQPTRPTVQLPNQMMRMYPQRSDYIDDQISGFPLIIVSHRLGQAFSVKPLCTNVDAESWKKKMTYDHDLEITRPWYYSTYLIDDDATVEFVPGKKTGIYRFTFPANAKKKTLLFNSLNGGVSDFTFLSPDEIAGTETYHDDIKIYLYGKFSSAGTPGTLKNNELTGERSIKGNNTKCYINFSESGPSVIAFSYAISYISPEQAHKNFENELSKTSFENLKDAGRAAWAKVMQQIKVQGGTEAQKRSFYTALYRCYERMVDITEDGKYYSGFDKKIHNTSRPFYVDDWTWDTYLAHHPFV